MSGRFSKRIHGFLKSFSQKGFLFALVIYVKPPEQMVWSVWPKLVPDPKEASQTVEWGSLWKMWVMVYFKEKNLTPPDYICKGGDPEEVFCCTPGKKIGMKDAFAKSCGRYFEQSLSVIKDSDWKNFWKEEMAFTDGPLIQGFPSEDTRTSVTWILGALERVRTHAQNLKSIEADMLSTQLTGTLKNSKKDFGGEIRVKTYTIRNPKDEKHFLGGFAGWRRDGSAIWVRGEGKSDAVARAVSLSQDAKDRLLESLMTSSSSSIAQVQVAFFDRYPIRRINGAVKPQNGPLHGKVVLEFENGNHLEFYSQGEIQVRYSKKGKPLLTGHFSLDEYVARVMDREIKSEPVEAAKAFSILMRTFLVQNAIRSNDGYWIQDSSHLQRVSIQKASRESLKIAGFTTGMILKGEKVSYHSISTSKNRIGWEAAKKMAADGFQYHEILSETFHRATLSALEEKNEPLCAALPDAEVWLNQQSKIWKPRLLQKEGFNEPKPYRICKLEGRQPYTDIQEKKIFVNFKGDTEDQITLAHEYLHLAFASHPVGHQDPTIEKMAKELVLKVKPQEEEE